MEALIIATVTGVISSIATVVAIKVDIGWIKQTQAEFKERLFELEVRVVELQSK